MSRTSPQLTVLRPVPELVDPCFWVLLLPCLWKCTAWDRNLELREPGGWETGLGLHLRSSNASKDVLVWASNPYCSKCHTICSRQALWGHRQVSGRIKTTANTEILALTIARPCFNCFTYINTFISLNNPTWKVLCK